MSSETEGKSFLQQDWPAQLYLRSAIPAPGIEVKTAALEIDWSKVDLARFKSKPGVRVVGIRNGGL